MTEVENLTQKEIDELLEGNDSNGVENMQVDLDDDLILDEEPFDDTTKTNTRDSEESDKLTIDEEIDPEQSPVSDTNLPGPSYVDSTTGSAFNNNVPHGKKNSNEVPNNEEVTILDSDDEGKKPVPADVPRRRRKQAIYARERNLTRGVVAQTVANSDKKANREVIAIAQKNWSTHVSEHKERMNKAMADIEEMIRNNTLRMKELREEKHARKMMYSTVLEMQKEMESLKKEVASIVIVKPTLQPIKRNFQQQQPLITPPQHQAQMRTPSLHQPQLRTPPQHQQQPQQQQPRQVIIHPYAPQIMNGQIAMNGHNRSISLSNPSSMRKRSAEHFMMMPNEPRKNIRIEYPVMASPHEPLNQPTQHCIVQYEPTEKNNPGRAYGHAIEQIRENSEDKFELEVDKTNNGNRELVCLIPRIPYDGKNIESFNPQKPSFFMQYGSVDVVVNIKSSKNDFFENWQIAGTVEYPNCSNYAESKIDLFVQIHSCKTGLKGFIRQTDEEIDWGCVQLQNCSASKKTKFRIKFHKNQNLPINDKISIFASLDDGSRIYVSAISTLIYS